MPTRSQVVEYLRERQRDLSHVLLDIECRPFSDHADSPELVLAVDWSEIFAYVMGASPSHGSRAAEVYGDKHGLDSIHQVALNVLFDRGPIKDILLIEPYAREMLFFVERVRTNAGTIVVPLETREELLGDLQESDAFNKLMGMRAEIEAAGKTFTSESLAQFLEKEHDLRSQASLWISEKFRELFLFARIVSGDVLEGLRHLFREKEDGVRLIKLEQLAPDAARAVGASTAQEMRWVEELGALSEKRQLARRIDAQALEWIYQLNVHLAERRRQILFVTRDRDIPHVMRHHSGRFACLADSYSSVLQPNVPLLVRSWRYMFELGMVWSPDHQTMRQEAMRRLSEVEAKLEWLQGAGRDVVSAPAEIQKYLDEELRDDIQNNLALVTTERPWLPQGGPANVEKEAVRLFVLFVTDPVRFEKERDRIRESVIFSLEALLANLPFKYSPRFVKDAFSRYLPLAKSVIRHLPTKALVSDMVNPNARRYLSGIYDAIRREFSLNEDQATEEIVHLPPPAKSSTASIVEYRQVSTILYALGAFGRLEMLRSRFEEIAEDFRPLTPGWLIDVMIEADTRVIRDQPRDSNSFLRECWWEIKEHIADRQCDETESIVCVTFLNAWLLFHLDLVAEHGENTAEFPRWEDGVTEAEQIFERLFDVFSQIERQASSSLRVSVKNNLLYTAARLAPMLVDQRVLPRTEAPENRRERGESEVQKRNAQLQKIIDKRRSRLRDDALKRYAQSLRRAKDRPEHYDTLGYFMVKLADTEPHGSRRWTGLLRSSGELFEKALSGGAGRLTERTRVALERHQRLLEDYRKGPEPDEWEATNW